LVVSRGDHYRHDRSNVSDGDLPRSSNGCLDAGLRAFLG